MKSDLKQSAPYRNSYGVRPIVGSQFVHKILNVEIDRGLRNRKLIGNLLVPITISNEPEYLQLANRQIVIGQMLGQAGRYFRWNVPFASVHRPDHSQQFVFRHALKEVTCRSRSQSAGALPVAGRSCKHDDTGLGILAANGDQGIGAIRSRKTKIHQRYIRLMPSEL